MTEMALFYAAFAMTVLTVLSNRYWRRQLRRTRGEAERAREKAESISREVAAVAARYAGLSHDHSTTEARMKRTEAEVTVLSQELTSLRQAGADRYYIFDRLEPRQGRIWEVSVRFYPEQAGERLHHRTWNGLRRYILVSDNERDAKHRASMRFPRKSGFEVVQIIPCKIANLTINRVNEFSTFRRPGSEEDGEDKKPARATQPPRS
jgi:hypothetical protein